MIFIPILRSSSDASICLQRHEILWSILQLLMNSYAASRACCSCEYPQCSEYDRKYCEDQSNNCKQSTFEFLKFIRCISVRTARGVIKFLNLKKLSFHTIGNRPWSYTLFYIERLKANLIIKWNIKCSLNCSMWD